MDQVIERALTHVETLNGEDGPRIVTWFHRRSVPKASTCRVCHRSGMLEMHAPRRRRGVSVSNRVSHALLDCVNRGDVEVRLRRGAPEVSVAELLLSPRMPAWSRPRWRWPTPARAGVEPPGGDFALMAS